MSPARGLMARGLAKGLGIQLEHDVPRDDNNLADMGVDSYVEKDPTPSEWIKEGIPSGHQVWDYFYHLFPFLQWLGRYNGQYLMGDLIAGVTVGVVLVPESIAYARLAGLDPQFGLYASLVGPMVYWIFATSKDISVGPIAVMSAITGRIVAEVALTNPEIPSHVVASALSLVTGIIVSALGLFKLGFLVDLIPLPTIYAFMTGAAISISTGQLPSLLGVPHRPSLNNEPYVNTRDPAYLVFLNLVKRLPEARIDAALGLSALTALYAIRYITTKAARVWPSYHRILFFLNTIRITFVILLYTMVSWLVNRNHKDTPMFDIVGTVPAGLQNLGVPVINVTIVQSFTSQLPVVVVILLLEHIACGKSFGRINSYTIQSSQEILASGTANIIGTFFGGFLVTGSFARTAINSKAGIRTPLSGVMVAIIILLAIFVLPPVFFYFPISVLSAILIHAVLDLIVLPEQSYRIFRVDPFDFIIFMTGVLLSLFTTLELGIYVTVSLSAAVLVFQLMKTSGRFLGKVNVRSTTEQSLLSRQYQTSSSSSLIGLLQAKHFEADALDELVERHLFLPIHHEDGSNPEVKIEAPLAGIFIYRFSGNFSYMNASHTLEQLLQTLYGHTQRTNPNTYKRPGDRPWNAACPKPSDRSPDKPHLKSIILDFSAISNVDSTSISALHDLRNQLDHYASPDQVSWHFANINSRWTKKALTAAGFGYDRRIGFGAEEEAYREKGLRPIYNLANVEEDDFLDPETHVNLARSVSHEKEAVEEEYERGDSAATSVVQHVRDVGGDGHAATSGASITTTDTVIADQSMGTRSAGRKVARRLMVSGHERPFFHVDLTSALQSAVAEARHRLKTAGVAERDTGVLP